MSQATDLVILFIISVLIALFVASCVAFVYIADVVINVTSQWSSF